MNTKRKNAKRAIIVAALLLVLVVGAMSAYFTDADTATNTFVYGKVSIDLYEPSWDPDNANDVVPNEVIAKDPKVKNDGVNPAYIFMEVKVPYANVITANADGTRNATADTELFSYVTKAGWVEVGTAQKADGVATHLYAYAADGAMTSVAAAAETGTLFDTVTVANVIEGQGLELASKDIVVNAYAIQAENLGTATAPADVWQIVANQNGTTPDMNPGLPTDNVTENAKTDAKN